MIEKRALGIFENMSYKNETEISRVTRSKGEAKSSYDRMSIWYDLIAGRFEKKYRDIGLQKLNAKKRDVVLEIGFGTGQCILALARSVGASGKIYGIDISDGMYNIAQSKIEEEELSERVELTCGDAVKLPFETEFFDAVFISFTLELFDTPEIPTVLHECYRVLRNGSRICVVSLSKKKYTSMMRLYEWMHKKFPNYLDCRPIFVQDVLQYTGFQILDVTELSMFGLAVEIVLGMKKSFE